MPYIYQGFHCWAASQGKIARSERGRQALASHACGLPLRPEVPKLRNSKSTGSGVFTRKVLSRVLPGLFLASLAVGAQAAPRYESLTLAGPGAVVSYPLMHMAQTQALSQYTDKLEFRLWQNPDQLRVLHLQASVLPVAAQRIGSDRCEPPHRSDLQRTSRRHIQRRAEHRQAPHHALEHVQPAVLRFAADREAGSDRLQARAGYMHGQGQADECGVVAGLQQQFAAQRLHQAADAFDPEMSQHKRPRRPWLTWLVDIIPRPPLP